MRQAVLLFLSQLLLLGISATIIDVFPTTVDGINGAVNMASSGDVVRVHAGKYIGDANCGITIASSNFTMLGDGPEKTIVDCTDSGIRCLNLNGVTNVSVVGIQFKNGYSAATTPTRNVVDAARDAARKIKYYPAKRRDRSSRRTLAFSVQYFVTETGELEAQVQVKANRTTMKRKRGHHDNKLHKNYHLLNQGGAIDGGCILIVSSVMVVLQQLIVRGGQAENGGGIAAYGSDLVSIVGCLVDGNGGSISTDVVYEGIGMYFESCGLITVASSNVTNNFFSTSGGGSGIGTLAFLECDNAVIIGPVNIANNQLASTGAGQQILGAGVSVRACGQLSIQGPVTVANNTLLSRGAFSFGAGIYIYYTPAYISGGIRFFNNTILAYSPSPSSSSPYVPPPRTSSTKHCGGILTISNTMGTISEDDWSNYTSTLSCTWIIQPPPVFAANYVLNVTFSTLQTGPNDGIYLFDGSSMDAPRIQVISGSTNPQVPTCWQPTYRSCPSSSFITTKGQILIWFTAANPTKIPVTKAGFSFSWKIVQVKRTTGITGTLLASQSYYPINQPAGGAGIYAYGALPLSMKNVSFEQNLAVGPFSSFGAALYTQSSSVTMSNVEFRSNSNQGVHSGGAAISAISSLIQCVVNCNFISNTAVAVGNSCFLVQYQNLVICPSAFGGSILVTYGSVFKLKSSSFVNNSAACSTGDIPCQPLGGSIAVVQSGAVLLLTLSKCSMSHLFCPQNTCLNQGGCMFLDSTVVNVTNCTFENNNLVGGVTLGGGAFATGNGVLSILNSVIQYNSAMLGGGVAANGFAKCFVMDGTVFQHNIGLSVAGAIYTKEDASLYISRASFVGNDAARESEIMTLNDDNKAVFSIADTIFWVNLGNNLLMLGPNNFNSGTSWTCMHPGTVFVTDITSGFFSLTCKKCDSGTYAVDPASTLYAERICQSCPFGGKCLGSSPSSNGLFALTDYWGMDNNNGSVRFYLCPNGYCCSRTSNCTINHCEGNRVGTLCGECAAGYGMRFFSQGCSSDDTCQTDVGWFAFVIATCAVLEALFLLKTTGQNESSGLLSVLLYFYQVLPLIKSSAWKYTSPEIIVALQSVFNFSPSGSSSDSHGACLFESMTTSQKLGLRMLLQGVIFSAVPFIFVLHWVSSKVSNRLPVPKIPHYLATSVRFCTIAYTTLVLVPLQMIQCTYVNRRYIWWWDGSVECYETWQKGGFVAIAFLSPLPFLVAVMLGKFYTADRDLDGTKKEICNVLSSGFSTERRWWLGISLYRRLLFVVVYSAILDGNWKSMASTVLCVIFLMMNYVFKPFKVKTTHNCETASLLILTLISVSTSPQLSHSQFGTPESIFDEASLEWIQFALAISPIVGFIGLRVYTIVLSQQQQKDNSNKLVPFEEATCEICKGSEYEFANECSIHQYC